MSEKLELFRNAARAHQMGSTGISSGSVETPSPAAPSTGEASALQIFRQAASASQTVPAGVDTLVNDDIEERDGFVLGSPFMQGIAQGVRGMGTEMVALRAMFSDMMGADESRDRLLARYLERVERAEQERQEFATLDSIRDAEGVFDTAGEFAEWLSFSTGQVLPTVGTVILGGGVGGAVAKGLAKGAVTKYGAQAAGSYLTSATLETGATAGEQYLATGEFDPTVAFGAGMAKGALETITPLALGRAVGLLGVSDDAFLKLVSGEVDNLTSGAARVATSAGKTGAVEAATEVTQEAIDIVARRIVDEKYDMFGEEAKERIYESFWTALATGGVLGGAGSLVAPRRSAQPDGVAEVQDGAAVARAPGEGSALTTGQPSPDPVSVPDDAPLITVLDRENPNLMPNNGDALPVTFTTSKTAAAGRQDIMEFEAGSYAWETSMADVDARDFADQVFVQPTKDVLAGDISAPVYMLPGKLDPKEDANISFREEGQTSKALRKAREALTLLKAGKTQEAKTTYRQALEAGFRYKTDGQNGFVAIGQPSTGLRIGHAPNIGMDLYQGYRPTLTFDPETSKGPVTMSPFQGSGQYGAVHTLRPEARKSDRFTENTDDLLTDGLKVPEFTPLEVVEAEVKKAHAAGRLEVKLPEGRSLIEFAELIAYGDISEQQQWIEDGLIVHTNIPGYRPHGTYFADGRAADFMQLNEAFVPQGKQGPAVPRRDFVQTMQYFATRIFPQYTSTGKLFANVKGKMTQIKSVMDLADQANTGITVLQDGDQLHKTDKRFFNSAVSIATRLHKTFMPKDSRLILYLYDLEGSDSRGFHYTDDRTGKTSVIGINIGRVSGMQRMALTIAHEFGHAMSANYLLNEKTVRSGLTGEVLNAYYRWQQRATRVPTGQFASEGFTLFRGLMFNDTFARLNRLDESVTDNVAAESLEYQLSFEEWIAENVATYISSNITEHLGTTERFFTWFSRRMKAVYADLAKQFPQYDFHSDTAVQAFVAYTKAQRDGTVFNLEKTLSDLRYHHTVWSPRIKAFVDKSQPNPMRSLVDGVQHSLDSKVLAQETESGRTLKEELETLEDASDYFNSTVKWGWNVLQLAMKNPHIRHLQRYVSKATQWSNEKSAWQALANETVRKWKGLGKVRADNLAKLLLALDRMEYLPDDVQAVRHPTKAELQALFEKYNIDEATAAVYEQVKHDFDAILDRLEQISIEQMHRRINPGSPEALIEQIRIKADFGKLKERPYFPHARFGTHAVIVFDAKGKVVHMEHVEPGLWGAFKATRGKTPKAVLQLQRDLQKEYPDGRVAIDRVPEEAQVFLGMPTQVLHRIRAELSDSLSPEQKNWLDRLAIEYAPSASFRRRLMQRANTPGYSQDAMRAYANYFWHGSNHMARISYGQDMKEVIEDFRKENSKWRRKGSNISKRTRMVDMLEDHVEHVLNPVPDWAQLRSIAFTWWLGFSPASAVLNFTQLPLVTVPYLSARFGDLKTANEMKNAAVQLRKMYTDPVTMAKKWNPQDARLMELGLQQGFLEESLAMELAGVAEGNNLLRAKHGSRTQRAMSGFAHAAGWMFQASEKINRRITFNAAVNLARKNPNTDYLQMLRDTMASEYRDLTTKEGLSVSEATAFLAGKDAVRRTQFEYAAWARPRFMRGKKGVIFTFFMFLQNMLWTVGNSPGNKRILLTMLLMGGLMGLPGADDMQEVVEFFGRKMFGKRFKAEEELAKFLTEMFGDNRTADLILHGAGREGFGLPALGDMLGIPIPKFDMSGSVGMGNVVPGLAEALNNDGSSFEEVMGRVTTDVAGASLGIGINMFKFLNDTQLPIDDMKRWERAMPRAMKNVVRSMRYVPPDTELAKITGNFVVPEGRERTRTGATVIAFEGDDPEHMLEIAAAAMGFQPTRLNREWNDIIARREAIEYWRARRGMLMNQYWHTLYTNDKEARKDVIDAISKFNREIPHRAIAITRETLSRSVKTRTTRMRQQEAGIEPTKMFRALANEIGSYYPNKHDDPTVISVEEVK